MDNDEIEKDMTKKRRVKNVSEEKNETSIKNEKVNKNFILPVPPGTPFTIMLEAAKKFNLVVSEVELNIPLPNDAYLLPKTLVLKGPKANLSKAKKFIRKRLKERVKELASYGTSAKNK
ncbi:MAG: hypothetical protein N3E48_05260 [Candidatus Bathyarchaeota archaeon]|nr:hypothetical protein [Candidatus Bathyarchaeota archaeon]